MQTESEIFFIHLLIIISSRNFFGEISPSFHNYVYSTKSHERQIKAKRLKVTKKIYQKMISLILP